MAVRSFVAKITLPADLEPEDKQAIDSVVDELVALWNNQYQHAGAGEYINNFTSARAHLLQQSIYRFEKEDERYRVAMLLLQLADTVYSGAVAPWVR